jgi:hypothetical protein
MEFTNDFGVGHRADGIALKFTSILVYNLDPA